MCGRFAQRTPAKTLAREYRVDDIPDIEPRYNIAPAQDILSVRRTGERREAALIKWGLVPSWAKDTSIGAKLINARSEMITEKPSFREAFKRRRCIIPADGFYEWQRTGGKKQPYFFHMRDGHPFGFAGLWEKWRAADGRLLETCAILTTEANETLKPVHDRMPVILHPDGYDLWLDDDLRKLDLVKELLCPYPSSEMLSHPVSTNVNSTNIEGMDLIKPLNVRGA
jgi:putative SOS response-associated peptidase YedK